MQRSNHFVIVGDSALGSNTCRELQARHEQVTFVYQQSAGPDDPNRDVVVGKPNDLEVLRKAGAAQAKAVLALSENDDQNAFVVLAMHELAPGVKTVVLVRNPDNLANMRRVHPDLIFSPQLLGGELLAMTLSGEPINTENLLGQLLQYRA